MLDDLHALVEFAQCRVYCRTRVRYASNVSVIGPLGRLRWRPNISWSRPSHPGSQSYGCDGETQTHRDLTALGRNADLFQDLIVHG